MSIWRRLKTAEEDVNDISGDVTTLGGNVSTVQGNITTILGQIQSLGAPTVLTLESDATTGANVNPITVTGLVFNYAANSRYKIELFALISSPAATTGCGFQFDLSSAVTRIGFQFYHQLANTGTLTGGHTVADDASVGVSTGIPANAGIYPANGSGILITAGNTGTAQLRFRSETTAVTTCKAGTVLMVTKI